MTESFLDRLPSDRPDEAFAALGDETRLRILFELTEYASKTGYEEGLSFAQLRRRAGVEDAGRFAYHLDELREVFVYKNGDEYRPRFAAMAVVAAVAAGAYAAADGERSAELSERCPICSNGLVARYAFELLVVECPDHGQFFSFPVPPGAARDRSLPDLVDVGARRAETHVELARSGQCPRCWGDVSIDYPAEPEGIESHPADVPYASVECERCWLTYPIPLPSLVANHPAVVAAYERHGIDPSTVRFDKWSPLAVMDATIVETEPARARIDFDFGDGCGIEDESELANGPCLEDDCLTLVFDEDAQVVERQPDAGDN